MKIREIKEKKKEYLPLLLLADEQEEMIDRYLEKGAMYVLEDDGVKSECVVTDEGNGILEIKSLATKPEFQRKGYGKEIIKFLLKEYNSDFSVLQVGTGESPLTIPFYKKCGFSYSHRVENFFTDYYDHPIYEDGIQLRDMIYLCRPFYSIRKFQDADLEAVMQIWLESNLQAHPFIDASYWENSYEAVKEMLPYAEIYVGIDKSTEQVVGFIGLSEQSDELYKQYIEGIFVQESVRSRGVGTQLLEAAKSKNPSLALSVYEKNQRAIRFYLREGFQIQKESIDESTNEKEYLMVWKKR